MTWFWIITVIVGLIGIAQVLAMMASRRADRILKRMEKQYEDVVEVLLAQTYLKDENMEDREEAIHTCMQALKPYIDSLLSHINATDASDVKVNFPTKYFANVASFADSLFYKRHKNSDFPISKEDEDKMYAILKDAISADVIKRTLYLKAGKAS